MIQIQQTSFGVKVVLILLNLPLAYFGMHFTCGGFGTKVIATKVG